MNVGPLVDWVDPGTPRVPAATKAPLIVATRKQNSRKQCELRATTNRETAELVYHKLRTRRAIGRLYPGRESTIKHRLIGHSAGYS